MSGKLSEILSSISFFRIMGHHAESAGEITISGISHDSRKVMPGHLFIALAGSRYDGHHFIPEAISRGAVAVMTDRDWPPIPTKTDQGPKTDRHMPEDAIEPIDSAFEISPVPVIVVADTLQSMAKVSSTFFGNPERAMEIFGVTGTNGKTTTTYLLEAVLEPCAVLGTIEYRIGERILDRGGNTTPLSMELFGHLRTIADAGISRAVMEVSSHALRLHRVDGMEFSGAIFTNITPEHLDFHTDMPDYLDAKRRIFDMTPTGPLCIGTVSPQGRELFIELSAAGRRAIAFGAGARELWETRGHEAGGWLEAASFDMGSWGLEARLGYRLPSAGNGEITVKSELTGLFNLLNISGAAALLVESGIEPERVAAGVGSVKRVPGRFEPVRRNGVTAVVDYAHTSDSLENVLSALAELRKLEGGAGKIITVFGCGGDRDRTKRPVMGAIASRMSDAVVVTSDNPRTENPASIIQEILAGMDRSGPNLHTVEDRREAIRRAIRMARPGDFVLVAGKGHEDYQILGREKVHFDDREEIEMAFGGNE